MRGDDLPDGEGPAVEIVTASTMDNGAAALTIDESPLDWCLRPGGKLIAWSWDPPFSFTRQRFSATGDPTLIWEGQKAGRNGVFLHIEKLTNLDQLPPGGFTLSCLPVKVKRASAGWCRAVALLND